MPAVSQSSNLHFSISNLQSPVEFSDDTSTLTLQVGAVQLIFDKATGMLLTFGDGERSRLLQGPQLNAWRGATDNDGIKLMMAQQYYKPIAHWLNLGSDQLQQRLESIRVVETDDELAVRRSRTPRASGRGDLQDFHHTQRYTLLPSGELQITNQVKLGNDANDLPRIGVTLNLRPELEHLTWYGRGKLQRPQSR